MKSKGKANIELIVDSHLIDWKSYELARKVLPLGVTLKPKQGTKTTASKDKQREEQIYQAVVLYILDGGIATPSAIQTKLKISFRQAKQALERTRIERIKENQKEFLERSSNSTISKNDLFGEVLAWAKNHQLVSTSDIVRVFRITDEEANNLIHKMVQAGVAEIKNETPKNPASWKCLNCGYQNLSFSSYCTDCFTQAPSS